MTIDLPNTCRNQIQDNHIVYQRRKTGEHVKIPETNSLYGPSYVGNKCVFGYGTKIAGDCEIGNGVIFSSGAIQNANTRAGDLSLIQAGCAFSHDVPPYVIAGGSPMVYGGPNTTMMNYAGIDEKVQKHIANAYRLLFHGKTSVFDVINQIKDQVPDSPEIRNIIQFLEGTKQGIMCK